MLERFDYKTDYLGDYGTLALDHLEVITLYDFDICWEVDSDKCPPNLYIVVAVELQASQVIEVEDGVYQEVWVDVQETAYAVGAGVFDRNKPDSYWGYYVIYPVAKVETGY